MIQIVPISGLPEIVSGLDLAEHLAAGFKAAGLTVRAGDILVVTQKIVSKAEGRLVRLEEVVPGAEALELCRKTGKDARLVELILRESVAIVRAAPNVLIVRHRLGLVMANAGIDGSNTGPGEGERVLLLPVDPDASAKQLAQDLARRLGAAPAVIISDSFGRPWRHGVVNVAIGASGMPALFDRRGDADRDGRRLEVTQQALADMVAAAAGLMMGEGAEGIPAVLIRGCVWQGLLLPASALIRPLNEDLFR